uniref:NADH:ubiquinone reductase (H(+)-translocating) n=1 Tax=Naesiotus nux TaxID=1755238 RepID=A0A0S2IA58_NAENU|nr:NADH dehydrogenase subunit 5 [Naesiotus nux]ALO20558.1 NADH dehydrogenase subunit 5 [Naesiotus nux]
MSLFQEKAQSKFMMIKSYYRFSVLMFFISVFLLSNLFLMVKNNNSFIIEMNLMSVSTLTFSLAVIFDWVSLLFSFHVLVISFSVFWFARFYMSGDIFFYRFIWLLMLFVISMNILIFSSSLFILFLGWDGLGVTSFALIIYYSSKESLFAGFLTLMVNRLGDILIISSVVWFIQEGSFLTNNMSFMTYSIIFLLSLGALTKSAQYPFSAWLPAAMAAPTPVSALVHSSTLVTAGVYLVIRLSMLSGLPESVNMILQFCGALTSFLGGIAALFENDLKKIIALSTLSQLGVMIYCLSLNLTYLSFFHLLTHATFKAMLFLCAGMILMASYGIQDLRLLGGIGKKMPLMMCFMMISSFCLVALPFTNAFFTKHLILEMMMMSMTNSVFILMFYMGSIFTGIYVIRMLKILHWGELIIKINEISFNKLIYLPFVFLSLLSVMSGKLLSGLFMEFINPVFITPWAWWGFNMMIPLALLFIIIPVMLPKNSVLLSSLFFLSPISYNLKKFNYPILKSTNNLDLGWMEPSVYTRNSLPSLFNFYFNLFSWPSKLNNSFLMSMFFIVVLIYLWLYT